MPLANEDRFRSLTGGSTSGSPGGDFVQSLPGTTSETTDVFARLFEIGQMVTLASGVSLVVLLLIQGVLLRLVTASKKAASRLRHVLNTSNTNGERRLKWAATRKVNSLLLNAHTLHRMQGGEQLYVSPARGHQRRFRDGDRLDQKEAIRNFVLYGEQSEEAGGFVWTWKRILDGTLYNTEGIWINTRLIVVQSIQLTIAFLLTNLLFQMNKVIQREASRAREELQQIENLPAWVLDIIPTDDIVRVSLVPATVCASLVMILIFLLYIPRYVVK